MFYVNVKAAGILAAVSTMAIPAHAAATFYGPTSYLSFADSPFKSLGLAQFYLENFEDGLLNTPGVSIGTNQPGGTPLGVVGPGATADSVDSDDGVVNGLGQNGRSYANLANNGYENYGLTVTFSAGPLNGLPTYAGLVWTDGSQTALTVFEAFDASGVSLGTVGPVKIGDSSFFGTTGEDRFFGVSNAGGISKLVIRDPGGINNMEIDHLQYGLNTPAVPEAPTSALIAIGALGLMWRIRSDKNRARGQYRIHD